MKANPNWDYCTGSALRVCFGFQWTEWGVDVLSNASMCREVRNRLSLTTSSCFGVIMRALYAMDNYNRIPSNCQGPLTWGTMLPCTFHPRRAGRDYVCLH